MKARTQKLLSILCLLALLLGMLPMTATAAGIHEHNFTESEKISSYFTISGNMNSKDGSVTYNGTTYTKNLKMESATSIKFTAEYAGELVLVTDTASKSIKVNNAKYTTDGKGVATVKVPEGAVEITKGDSMNLFYISFSPLCDGHEPNESGWTTVTPASCYQDGLKKATCKKCTTEFTEVIPASTVPHTWAQEGDPDTNFEFHLDGGCTEAGYKQAKCKVEGCTAVNTEQITVSAPGHKFKDGKSAGICQVCNLEATGAMDTGTEHQHVWDSTDGTPNGEGWVVTKAATCGASGTKTRQCTNTDCPLNTKKTETIPATGDHKDTDNNGICDDCNAALNAPLSTLNGTAGGWFETLYAEIPGMTKDRISDVSYDGTMTDYLDSEALTYLVRETTMVDGKSGVRIDIPGLTAGKYTLTVTVDGTDYTSEEVEVKAYDRSGYAHWNYTEGVGAYRDDGILKEDAIVLYVTNTNKNTVALTGPDGKTVTGIGNILNSVGADTGNGLTSNKGKPNTNGNILKKLADNDIPLVVRIIGNVENPEGTTAFGSVDYGGSKDDQGNMARVKHAKNITIEGIGPDATLNGWGLHFISSAEDPAAGRGYGFEVRNVAFRNVPEDCIGMEGTRTDGVDYNVERGWVHNCAFYGPHFTNTTDSDKAGGDGACDFKRGEYFTMSYNYFEGYHKTNLVGSGDSVANGTQHHITWHHNHWVNCEARGPLGRKANMHLYNNLYEGQTDYAMNTRVGAYIFSEYNALINCKNPMRVDDNDSAIKSYNDVITSYTGDLNGVFVEKKTDVVKAPGNLYESFELDPKVSYIPSGDYLLDTDHAVAQAKIKAYGGPMKNPVVEPDVEDSSLVDEGRTIPDGYVSVPYNQALNSSYVTSVKQNLVKDNVSFYVYKTSASNITLGGKEGGGSNIIFKVNEAVDITITQGDGSKNPIILMNGSGETLVTGTGTAKSCPAGVYIVQCGVYDTGNKVFKEGLISNLKIDKAAVAPHEHSWDSGKQTVAPTCTREGVKIYTCTNNCPEGATKTEAVPMIAHDYVGGECSVCHLMQNVVNDGQDDMGDIVYATGLTLKPSTLSPMLQTDGGVRVVATVEPANATSRFATVTWTSADTSVATVAKNGTITPVGPGVTTVTASVKGQTQTFSQTVTVTVYGVNSESNNFVAKNQGVTSSKDLDTVTAGALKPSYFQSVGTANQWKRNTDMSIKALRMGAKGSGSITFTVSDSADSADVTISFSSTGGSNRSILALKNAKGELQPNDEGYTVSTALGTGLVTVTFTGLRPGTYTIYCPGSEAKPADAGLEAWGNDPTNRGAEVSTITVTEKTVTGTTVKHVESVSVSPTSLDMKVGESATVTATVLPADATLKTVNWSTSNASVAVASNGLITARGVGSATITATADGKSATVKVTVTPAAVEEPEDTKVGTITITGPNGVKDMDVDADDDQVVTVQLTATIWPSDAKNKAVTWSSDSVDKGVSVDQTGKVTVKFDAVTCKATITATAQDGSGVKGTFIINVTAAPVAPTTDNLEALVKKAQAMYDKYKDSIEADTVAEGDVAEGTEFVHESDMTALDEALQAAKAVLESATPTEEAIQKAIADLEKAYGDLTVYTGSKEDDTGDDNTGSTGGNYGGGGSGKKPADDKTDDKTDEPTTPDTKTGFADVAEGDWFADVVKTIAEKGLMKGIDDTHFAPQMTTSRAMVATILFRLDGENEVDVDTAFTDLAAGSWYDEAVQWANEKGVVKGYSDTAFGPDDNVTREQLAVMLYRYAALKGMDVTGAADLSAFVDVDSVSDFATEAMAWAVNAGIINGRGNNDLAPLGNATRAEVAAMIVRFIDLMD